MTKEEVPDKIIEFLRKQDWPVTTEEIAKAVGVSWNTAQVYLWKMVAQGKLKNKKVGRQNQWWLAEKYKKEF